jgi:protein SCO1/2
LPLLQRQGGALAFKLDELPDWRYEKISHACSRALPVTTFILPRKIPVHGGVGMCFKKTLASVCATVALAVACFGNQAAAAEARYQRTVETYSIPDVVLVNQDGEKVHFRKFLETDKPVMLDFIYGTCTTICPVLSATFVNFQRKMGPDSAKVRLVSISIDPENDTPKVMKDYLKKYHAKPGWDFLTGSREDIDKVMRAFNSYISNKMFHFPLTLIRSPKDGRWIRINGLMSSSELMSEYQKVIAP